MFAKRYKERENTSKSGVYRITCKDCTQSYIGETGRAFFIRKKEHVASCNHYIKGKSAIADHVSTHNHSIDFDNARVVYPQDNQIKRKIAEALIISGSEVFENNSPSFQLSVFN